MLHACSKKNKWSWVRDSSSLEDFASEVPTLTVGEAAAVLKLHRASVYAMCERKELACLRTGAKLRIPFWALMDCIGRRYGLR